MIGAVGKVESCKVGAECVEATEMLGQAALAVVGLLIDRGGIVGFATEVTDDISSPAKVAGATGNGYILAPLGVIEKSVGVLQALGKADDRIPHIIGCKLIKITLALGTEDAGGFKEAHSLDGGFYVGKEAGVVTGGV